MRMFLSVSGKSSELNIANHSSRSTVSQPKLCLRHYNKPQKTKISIVYCAPFIQNSNQMASGLTVATSFPRVFFSTPVIFKATSKLFGSQGSPRTKTDLIFLAFSSRFVNFEVQFCFRCKFSFNEERHSTQV